MDILDMYVIENALGPHGYMRRELAGGDLLYSYKQCFVEPRVSEMR
jgi:hypothetical protein